MRFPRHSLPPPITPHAAARSWPALALGAGVIVRPALATSPQMQAAIRGYTHGAPVNVGKVLLDVSPLVENGNAVFNERNPQRDVVRFTLGPRAGRALVSSRIRLDTSQQLVAVARLSDGTYWSHAVDVLVTLAACLE